MSKPNVNAAALQARFLGIPELSCNGEKIDFPFLKARILAMLLIEEGTISRDKLCELLWGDKTLESGRRNLSNALSFVRNILPVHTASKDLLILGDELHIEKDTASLENLKSLTWEQMSPFFEPFMNMAELEEWEFLSDWLRFKRHHYRTKLLNSLTERARASLDNQQEGYLSDAARCYEKMAEIEPYDEIIHGELVRLYIKAGRKVDAVRMARSFSNRIEEDLGIKGELSEVASLMKREASEVTPVLSSVLADSNPLAEDKEILGMIDFLYGTEQQGKSSCGFVWGEEGIGKGEFIKEVLSHFSDSGWTCYTVRCSQEEKNRPMVPFLQLLQRIGRSFSGDGNTVSLAELNYSRVAELVCSHVMSSPGGPPKLLAVENIQWMDEASWVILETLLWDQFAPHHVLISGYEEIRSTFMLRTAIMDEPIEKLEVTLKRFDLNRTGKVCKALRPDQQWTEAKIKDVYSQTEGNPFFIRELLLQPDNEAKKEVQRIFKNPFAAKIELMSREERLFLETIAIFPGPVSMLQISGILDMSPLKVSIIHDNIRLYGFLREKDEGNGDVSYYFTHVKIREALLERMSSARRNALHRSCIDVFRKKNPLPLYRNRSIFARLAWHCKEAGLLEDELHWKIGELKLHFQATHEVFPALTDPDLIKYIPTSEDLSWTENTLNETRRLIDRIDRFHGRTPEVFRCERDWNILKGGHLWWSGSYSDSLQMLKEGLRKALKSQEAESTAEAYCQLCYLAIQTDDGESLLFWGKALYRLAGNNHMHRWLGTAARFLAIANILIGRYRAAEQLIHISTRIFERLEETGPSYTVSLIAAEHFRGDLQIAQGNVGDALDYYVNCINMGESLGLYRGLGLSFAKAAYCFLLQDDVSAAEVYLTRMQKFQSLFHTDQGCDLQGGCIAFSLLGLVEAFKGNWQKSREYLLSAENLVSRTQRPTWFAILCWAKTEITKKVSSIPQDFATSILAGGKERYLQEMEQIVKRGSWILGHVT